MGALERHATLIEVLLSSTHPLTGEELAARLHVSSRTVRTYVRDVNKCHVIIRADRLGYTLDRDAYAETHRQQKRPEADTPDRRLRVLCRALVQAGEPVSVFNLAEQWCVSESTVEADLGRARELFRAHGLMIRRSREFISLEGPERARRRFLRQILFGANEGLVPATWQALISDYKSVNVAALRREVAGIVEAADLGLNEFALSDVVLHLTVTIDQVRRGHTLPPSASAVAIATPERIDAVTDDLVDAVFRVSSVTLPGPERDALATMLAVRAASELGEGSGAAVVDPTVRLLVNELIEETSSKYLLGPADPSTQLNLALHVQNLLARAHSGVPYHQRLGTSLRTSHPLVHDLAVDFAYRLEGRAGVEVAPGEVDFLALHLGMQYMRYLQGRDLVTITLVTPAYYDTAGQLASDLARELQGKALIEAVETTLDIDFSAVTSDLIVSTVDPGQPTAAPVVRVGPLLTASDRESVSEAVRRERERVIRLRTRATLQTLIDPALFVHVDTLPNKDEALALLAGRLESGGYVESHFLADVLDRESRSSTAFGGQFAIPHSMHMDANATAIAPLVSDKGIPWGESQVRLVFLFALSPDGREVFRDVLDEVIRLLSDPTHVAVLTSSGADADTFLTALMELLDRQSDH